MSPMFSISIKLKYNKLRSNENKSYIGKVLVPYIAEKNYNVRHALVIYDKLKGQCILTVLENNVDIDIVLVLAR